MKYVQVILVLGFILLLPLSVEAASRAMVVSPLKTARTTARMLSKTDYNCTDFTTQTAAQKFFIANGGPTKDPYRLDGDKDGIACETLK